MINSSWKMRIIPVESNCKTQKQGEFIFMAIVSILVVRNVCYRFIRVVESLKQTTENIITNVFPVNDVPNPSMERLLSVLME